MLKYRLYQNTRKGSSTRGEWYALPSIDETYDLEKLAQHMASHHTPFSEGTINGILKDMVKCIRELVLDGNAVKIPDLAIFSLGFVTKSAPTAKEFDANKNIKAFKLRSRATGVFSRDSLKLDANARELTRYSVDSKEESAGEGTGGTGEGSGSKEETGGE